jgi:hypothetical protein
MSTVCHAASTLGMKLLSWPLELNDSPGIVTAGLGRMHGSTVAGCAVHTAGAQYMRMLTSAPGITVSQVMAGPWCAHLGLQQPCCLN